MKRERVVIVIVLAVSGAVTVRVVGGAVETMVRTGAVDVDTTVVVRPGRADAEAVDMMVRAGTVVVTVTPSIFCVIVAMAGQELVSVVVAVVVRIEGVTIVAVVVAVKNTKEVFHFVA